LTCTHRPTPISSLNDEFSPRKRKNTGGKYGGKTKENSAKNLCIGHQAIWKEIKEATVQKSIPFIAAVLFSFKEYMCCREELKFSLNIKKKGKEKGKFVSPKNK